MYCLCNSYDNGYIPAESLMHDQCFPCQCTSISSVHCLMRLLHLISSTAFMCHAQCLLYSVYIIYGLYMLCYTYVHIIILYTPHMYTCYLSHLMPAVVIGVQLIIQGHEEQTLQPVLAWSLPLWYLYNTLTPFWPSGSIV